MSNTEIALSDLTQLRRRERGTRRSLSVVEVGGIEPPSHKALASASPSAANSELSEHEDSVGKHPHALSGDIFPHRSRNPGGGVPHCVALIRRGGHPPGGQERYLRCQCVTFVCTYMCTGSLTRTPVTSARFRRLNSHGRNHVTPAYGEREEHVHSYSVLQDSPRGHRIPPTRTAPLTAVRLRPLHFALLLSVDNVPALVTGPLALAQPELDLCLAVLEVHLKWDERQALLLDAAEESIDLSTVQQQLAGTFRLMSTALSKLIRRNVDLLKPDLSPTD